PPAAGPVRGLRPAVRDVRGDAPRRPGRPDHQPGAPGRGDRRSRRKRACGMSTPTTVPASERIVTTRSARLRAFIGRHIQVIAIAAVLVVLVVFFSATADRFMTVGNILNLLRQIAPTLIVAVAMTFVITTAGIDLSVGSIVAL